MKQNIALSINSGYKHKIILKNKMTNTAQASLCFLLRISRFAWVS